MSNFFPTVSLCFIVCLNDLLYTTCKIVFCILCTLPRLALECKKRFEKVYLKNTLGLSCRNCFFLKICYEQNVHCALLSVQSPSGGCPVVASDSQWVRGSQFARCSSPISKNKFYFYVRLFVFLQLMFTCLKTE